MPSGTTNAKLRWEEGDLPVSTLFDDPYYSRKDGLGESRHVFLGGNDLARRFATGEPFHIAELGFGTGLNMLAAVHLWRKVGNGTTLRLTSFEKHPMQAEQVARALSQWPELADLSEELAAQLPGPHLSLSGVQLTLIVGDVADTVPDWGGSADAWFLDGFAPSRNPQMWAAPILNAVARHTPAGGTFATYTAAGFVRRNLQAAGFDVQKLKGFGSKREMLTGRKP